MMQEVYTAEEFALIVSRFKKTVITEIAIILTAIAINVTLCLLVNDANAKWLEWVNIALSVMVGWVAIYLLFNVILPAFARKKYVYRLVSCERIVICGVVESTERTVTIEKNILVRELKVVDGDGNENLLYWDCAKELPAFSGDKEFEFAVVQNRIAAYGDAL